MHSTNESLLAFFLHGFRVRDIAELLASFDDTTPADQARSIMARKKYELVGVRSDGQLTGFLRRSELEDGVCGDYSRPFSETLVVKHTDDFPTLIHTLRDEPRAFVSVFGKIGAIVTRSDLQKPPVRMWLFGVVTLIEMGLTRMIEASFDDDEWHDLISAGRLEKATQLQSERSRRGREASLLECLQFTDRGTIVLRLAALRERLGIASRRTGEQTFKRLESLRNSLAHSQDIITDDWEAIVVLAENIDRVLTL